MLLVLPDLNEWIARKHDMKDMTQKKAEKVAKGDETRQAYKPAKAKLARAEVAARKAHRAAAQGTSAVSGGGANIKQDPVITLDPPEVAGIIDPMDGTLDSRVLNAPLNVTLEKWENSPEFPGDSNIISLQWAFAATPPTDADYRTIATLTIDHTVVFPITSLNVPLQEFGGDGPYSLRFEVRLVNNELGRSIPLPLIVDRSEPWRPDEPAILTFPVTDVTDAYLASQGGNLVGDLPDYGDWQQGDKYYVYADNTVPEDPPGNAPVVQGSTIQTGQKVTIPGASLTALGDGPIFIGYVLIDKALNRSRISHIARLEGAFGKLPSGFKPPVVPLAPGGGDDLIDLKDAATGVTVEIPAFNDHKTTDFIEVTWGSQVLTKEPIGSRPFPVSITVPVPALRADWGAATAEKPVNVSYRVLRGNVPQGTMDTMINVDFTYVGPGPGPDWPDPVNPALLAPKVKGKSGTAPDNELNRDDEGLDATLTFPLYDPALKDEQVTFYWGDVLVTEATYTVLGNEPIGKDISVTIPWSYIETRGNGDVPVHYRISGPASPNEQQSVRQNVVVDAITLRPDAPTFLGLNDIGWLTCVSLYDDPPSAEDPAIRVQVPDLTRYGLKDGDTVTVHWLAYPDRDPASLPIPGAEMDVDITLGTANPATGFVWRVRPYEDKILPTYEPGNANGRGETWYTFTIGSETFKSRIDSKYVGMYNANSSCPIPPVP
jgi:hypothetical protein